MTDRVNRSPSILCVELDTAVLESRCGLLTWTDYKVTYGPPQLAKTLLWSRKFDLILVSSTLGQDVLRRITHGAGRSPVLVLDGSTPGPN
jgi:hypothetical protein